MFNTTPYGSIIDHFIDLKNCFWSLILNHSLHVKKNVCANWLTRVPVLIKAASMFDPIVLVVFPHLF